VKPLRICLLAQEFPPHTVWGGVGVQFDNFAQAASALGHVVTVISRHEADAPEFERRAGLIDVWRVGVSMRRRMMTGRTVDRILYSRAVGDMLRELDAASRFDIIETTEANLEAEPLVRDPAFSHRTVICCHGGNLQGQVVDSSPLAPLHRLDFEWSCRREHEMLRRTRTIIVSSEATRAVVLGHGVDPRRIHLIPLGIDVNKFHPPTSARGSMLNVGFVGRLQERKGLDFVWKTMEKIGPGRNITFHFKGAIHPTTRSDTVRHLEQFSSFAEYHAPTSNEPMPEFMRTLDVLLLPSRFENFGLTYVEAMASGAIVFAGATGGGPEVVSDGVTGFLVDPDGPVDQVVARLVEIQAHPDRFVGMRQRARQEVVDRFSVDAFAAAKLALYRTIADRSGGE
jgi:glycogen(starch) synthase